MAKAASEPKGFDRRARDDALRDGRRLLSEAATRLKTAATHAGSADTCAHLQLLHEEALDVYTRVATLAVQLENENSESGAAETGSR